MVSGGPTGRPPTPPESRRRSLPGIFQNLETPPALVDLDLQVGVAGVKEILTASLAAALELFPVAAE